ncbi:hypothetical protein KC333_g4277, partial [Hortaea werneckii]
MATNRKINVLVYSGPGSTTDSVRHATWSLRRLLGPHYAVLTISADQLLKEPWTTSCALLVMPGGADMGYCRTLNGEGNRRIKQAVGLDVCKETLAAGGGAVPGRFRTYYNGGGVFVDAEKLRERNVEVLA